MKGGVLKIQHFAKYNFPCCCLLVTVKGARTCHHVVFRGRLPVHGFNLCFAPCTQAVSD